MEALGITYAIVTILAWGSWLVPAQNVKFANEQVKAFYMGIAAVLGGVLVVLVRGEWGQLLNMAAWIPLIGGLLWAVSAYFAFVGCKHIGIAKAMGIWAPLNIVVSFIWGFTLFGQLKDTSLLLQLIAIESVVIVIIGILMIIFSEGSKVESSREKRHSPLLGVLASCIAGILWGSYYIPAAYLWGVTGGEEIVSPWTSAFPLALGILIGTIVLVMVSGKSPRLERSEDYIRALASGVLWTAGNYGMLLMVREIGTGPGYTLASLCVIVNALWGIFLFKQPPPRSKAARLTLLGVLLATLAGIVLGNLNALEGMYQVTLK